MRHALDTLGPECLVELGVDADIGGAHRLLRKGYYVLHSGGGPLLEGATVYMLVQVDGVFTGDNVLESRTGLAGLL